MIRSSTQQKTQRSITPRTLLEPINPKRTQFRTKKSKPPQASQNETPTYSMPQTANIKSTATLFDSKEAE